MKWIFKTGEHFQSDSDGQKAIVTLVQKRNFTGEMGEDVLLLKKNTDWEFTDRYQIAGIEVKNQEGEYKEISITLVLVETFTEEKLLEDYMYSLRRVTNYATPIKHFSRKYNRLYDAEFEAIVEDKIYLKRTILGTVLNAMHPDHQKGYISYASMEAPEILTGKTDMDKALTLLLQYLDFAVVKPVHYLIEIAEHLKTIITEQELEQVGFADDIEKLTPKNTQAIKPQVDVIDKYGGEMLGFTNQKPGLQLLVLEDNQKFKTLFKNTPLPIALK